MIDERTSELRQAGRKGSVREERAAVEDVHEDRLEQVLRAVNQSLPSTTRARVSRRNALHSHFHAGVTCGSHERVRSPNDDEVAEQSEAVADSLGHLDLVRDEPDVQGSLRAAKVLSTSGLGCGSEWWLTCLLLRLRD